MFDKIICSFKKKLTKNTLGRKLIEGTSWTTLGTIMERGGNLASFAIAGNILTKINFGELGLLYSTVGMIGIFAGLGLSTTSTKYIAQYKDTDKEKTGRIIMLVFIISFVLSFSSALILFLSAGFIGSDIFNAEHLKFAIKYSAFFVLFEAMYKAQQGIIIGYEKFNILFIIDLIKGVTTLLLVIIGVNNHGVEGAIFGFTVSSFLSWLLQNIYINKINRKEKIKLNHKKLLFEINII